MPKRKTASVTSAWDSELRLLLWLATCASVISFLYYFQHHEFMLYGDAVAHINIARRVFDSKTPGLLQLGTVWLPLPHLLMIPFLLSNQMWTAGAGGSIPSLIAYVFGMAGIYRLIRNALSKGNELDAKVRVTASAAAIIYAANPNLIYIQTTAMGESLYLAFFIWAVVYFSDWLRGESKALTRCGLCLAAACLTRYDGWFLAAVVGSTVCAISFATILRRRTSVPSRTAPAEKSRPLAPAGVAKFILIAAAAPILWLAYNAAVYRNPLEFENGPYSAKAIEKQSQSASAPGHPGSGNPLVAGLYFVKSAEANFATNQWLQRVLLALATAGLLAAMRKRESRAAFALLLLLVPIPFYALSVAYGGVPIYIPAWWPYTHYNIRYGLQLLPAFAVGISLVLFFILQAAWSRRVRLSAILALLAVLIAADAFIWHASPICLQEAQINMRTHNQLDAQVAGWLRKLPADCTILMYLGDHVGAVQQAGIPLQHVINEGNHRVWMQPSDPDGLWERALANPAQNADYVVAFEGDRVWQSVRDRGLRELVEIHVTDQPRAILYRAR
jgi:hypothetical protein